MVTFEVRSSPDSERIGNLTLYLETFTLGNSRKSDLMIEDLGISPTHLLFFHNDEGLIIKSVSDNFYYSNDKKIKGGKLHKIGDSIKIGETSIEIKNLEFKNLSEKFNTIYDKALKEKPELEPLVTQLQKELIYLENTKDV